MRPLRNQKGGNVEGMQSPQDKRIEPPVKRFFWKSSVADDVFPQTIHGLRTDALDSLQLVLRREAAVEFAIEKNLFRC